MASASSDAGAILMCSAVRYLAALVRHLRGRLSALSSPATLFIVSVGGCVGVLAELADELASGEGRGGLLACRQAA